MSVLKLEYLEAWVWKPGELGKLGEARVDCVMETRGYGEWCSCVVTEAPFGADFDAWGYRVDTRVLVLN